MKLKDLKKLLDEFSYDEAVVRFKGKPSYGQSEVDCNSIASTQLEYSNAQDDGGKLIQKVEPSSIIFHLE